LVCADAVAAAKAGSNNPNCLREYFIEAFSFRA
jgi:hypothetical protein